MSDREDSPFRLDGKVAVVTGASRNVGLEISRTFAAGGATVVMAARDADRLSARATEIMDETGFGKGMLAGRGGAVINVLSGSAFQPTWQNSAYGSTKAALWTMTRYLAVELAPAVRVNALVPGLTMSDTGGPPAGPVVDSLLAMVPMRRPGRPDEVARAALYLASDAASYTSGTALFVNGGRLW
jgi:NAD(P)-dependent dehydrogenase (short-subunit alcohol dehydrogenase family)